MSQNRPYLRNCIDKFISKTKENPRQATQASEVFEHVDQKHFKI